MPEKKPTPMEKKPTPVEKKPENPPAQEDPGMNTDPEWAGDVFQEEGAPADGALEEEPLYEEPQETAAAIRADEITMDEIMSLPDAEPMPKELKDLFAEWYGEGFETDCQTAVYLVDSNIKE